MSKILAFDYGDKRIGVAVSDPSGTIASVVGAFGNEGIKKTIEFIKGLCKEHSAAKIVVGMPHGLSGKETEQTTKTKKFIKNLSEAVSLEIIEVDERFSSAMAEQQFIEKGQKARSEDVDSASARIFLQDYLDKNNN